MGAAWFVRALRALTYRVGMARPRTHKPDIATSPDLEMQVDLIGESGRGNEGAACWGLD